MTSRPDETAVREALAESPDNRRWLVRTLRRAARRRGIAPDSDPFRAARHLFAENRNGDGGFVAEALWDLPNRYPWTFAPETGGLMDQLRQEADVVVRAWETLEELARERPVTVILNERAPTDYFTCPVRPPRFPKLLETSEASIRLVTGVKIASSEHRAPLQTSDFRPQTSRGTPEGAPLIRAVTDAADEGRRPVLLDFSRRRFPRAFLRVARLADRIGWGIVPLGKVSGPPRRDLPGPKSPHGLPPRSGNPTLTLYDPWPVSDPEILSGMTPEDRDAFGGPPHTKPWQDDRIGARAEMEMDEGGRYRIVSRAWVLPTPSGWTRADSAFRELMADCLRRAAPDRGLILDFRF
jgi:hypothetical protein